MLRPRILFADGNAAFLERVAKLLEAKYEVVGRTTDGSRGCTEVKEPNPDVVLLDISFGAYSGIGIASRLRSHGYKGEIVFLSMHEDSDFVRVEIGAGGRGYVFKSRLCTDLEPAVTAALSHQAFVSPLNG